MLVVVLVAPGQYRYRQILILGLNASNWAVVAFFIGFVMVLVGTGLAASRLGARGRDGLALLLGIAVFAGAILTLYAGFLAVALSGVSDRTEVPLADGRSIVVSQNCWHHCGVTVYQRDGIYIDPLPGYATIDDSVDAAAPGAVTQAGDEVTVHFDAGRSLVVTLR